MLSTAPILGAVAWGPAHPWSTLPAPAMMPVTLNATGRHLAIRFWLHPQSLAVVYSVVFALGLAENVAAGSLLLWRLKRSGPTSVLLLSMTVATTAFTCALPLQIHYHLHGGDWHFGDLACRLSTSLHWAFMYLSTTSFFCLCLDRCLALAYPFTRLRLGKVHWGVGCGVLWALAGGVACPLALGGPLNWTSPDNRTSCLENFVEDVGPGASGTYALVMGFLVPCAIILGGYPLLAWCVASGRRTWRCRRTLRTLGFSMLLCSVCFLPYSFTHLLRHLAGPSPFLRHLRQVTLLLLSLSSCLGPIVCLPCAPRGGCRLWARLCRRRPKIFTIYDGRLAEPSCQHWAGGAQLEKRALGPAATGAPERLPRPVPSTEPSMGTQRQVLGAGQQSLVLGITAPPPAPASVRGSGGKSTPPPLTLTCCSELVRELGPCWAPAVRPLGSRAVERGRDPGP